MIINIVVQRLSRKRFSGGIWCIFEYASGLAAKGHKVNVIPYLPSATPEWFDVSGIHFIGTGKLARIKHLLRNILGAIKYVALSLLDRKNVSRLLENIHGAIYDINVFEPRMLPLELRQGISIRYLQEIMPEADITLATSNETALPVCLGGSGKLYYFMQHFEPFFSNESSNPKLAEIIATQSYFLGLNMIANSSWLKNKVENETELTSIELCMNAINHTAFNGHPKIAADSNLVKIISYGGRNAEWKGFREMAEAVSIARNRLTDVIIEWRVYGDALLPPDNTTAPYNSLGFLTPDHLADAYRDCDLLLSASWYESFPLFPLEAMACGLPVITTQNGTEDFAFHGETAHIVEARSPADIAEGIIKMVEDPDYRTRLARRGFETSHTFTWKKSAQTMESILTSSNISS